MKMINFFHTSLLGVFLIFFHIHAWSSQTTAKAGAAQVKSNANIKNNASAKKTSSQRQQKKPLLQIKSKLSAELATHNLTSSAITLLNKYMDRATKVKNAFIAQQLEFYKQYDEHKASRYACLFSFVLDTPILGSDYDNDHLNNRFIRKFSDPEDQKEYAEGWRKMHQQFNITALCDEFIKIEDQVNANAHAKHALEKSLEAKKIKTLRDLLDNL